MKSLEHRLERRAEMWNAVSPFLSCTLRKPTNSVGATMSMSLLRRTSR